MRSYKKNNKYHYKKETLTRYWKYVYEPWEQPVLTSNTSSDEITLSASSTYGSQYDMYKAFDDDTSTGWLSADGTYSGSLRVETKDTLSISSITIVGLSITNGYTKSVAIYKDLDNTELIGETQTFTAGETITWNFEEPIETSTLSFYAVGTYKWGCIAEIKINANKKTIQEATPDDYDFTTQENKYYAFR